MPSTSAALGYHKLDEKSSSRISSRDAHTVKAVIAAACCGGLVIGVLIGAGLSSSLGESPSVSPPPSSPPAPLLPPLPPGSLKCTAYDAKSSRTFDGLVEYEEGDEMEEGEEAAVLALNSPFAQTFFNYTCLRAGVTGDPCDVHVAETYVDLLFQSLRVDSIASLWVSDVFLFSLAQLGGIPRPCTKEDGKNDWTGIAFWAAWMMTQIAQYLVILISLAMTVVSYLGVGRSPHSPHSHLPQLSLPLPLPPRCVRGWHRALS